MLDGRRIWLTRPHGQADDLVRALGEAGAAVEHAPTLVIEPLAPGEPARVTAEKLLSEIDRFDHVIFISTNAVEHGTALLGELGIALPAGVTCHAIGAATAQALARHGISAAVPGGAMNSEALLAEPSLQALADSCVLIVRGIGGRRHLGDVLSSLEASVHYAEVYRRARPAALPARLRAALRDRRIDLIIAASGETVENIVALTAAEREAVLATPLVVPGERVAALARRLGFTRALVARSAATRDILAAAVAFCEDGERGKADRGGER